MSYVIRNGRHFYVPYLYNKSKQTSLWEEFPSEPGQINKFDTFWLKWEIEEKATNPSWGGKHIKSVAYCSRDKGVTWIEIDNFEDQNKTWYKNLLKEVEKAQEEAIKAHNRELARRRRETLKKEAGDAGLTVEEYKAVRSKKLKEKEKAKKQNKKAVKDARQTNQKMKLASSLKDLLEVANLLQEQLLDGTDLKLRYLDNRLHRIDQATRYLEEWVKRKNELGNSK